MFKIFLMIFCLISFHEKLLGENLFENKPELLQIIANPNPNPSLVNSVDFHPTMNLFCATFTHNNQIAIYRIDEYNHVSLCQTLSNPQSQLNHPQHAIFSRDGRYLIAANWSAQSFTFYRNSDNFYDPIPYANISFAFLKNYRPHGMTISSDDKYLAVAFGASEQYSKAIVLYQLEGLTTGNIELDLIDVLQNDFISNGIPKGITFSPDDTHLIVTFSETHSIAIFSIDRETDHINPNMTQLLQAPSMPIIRPEDVKFTTDGRCCAVTNSDADSILILRYDAQENTFLFDHRLDLFESTLYFPHGIAFSSNGKYAAISYFGQVQLDNQGVISWGTSRGDSIAIYLLH